MRLKVLNIVTESLGFRLEVSVYLEEMAGRGSYRTHEKNGEVPADALHELHFNENLHFDDVEMAEVVAHEVYHLFYAIRPLITADEETEVEVFGQLVKRITEVIR